MLKEGPLRVTLVVVGLRWGLAEHQAPGPITVQVVEGRVRFSTADKAHDLGPGQPLAAGPGHGAVSPRRKGHISPDGPPPRAR